MLVTSSNVTNTTRNKCHQETAKGNTMTNQPSRSIGKQPIIKPMIPKKTSTQQRQHAPSLGNLRSGSFCDVKTFTSGRVLDILSSSSADQPTKKEYGNYLDVNNEELKYCRYLRSPSSKENVETEQDIPMKFRPSKKIIIGHTKVASLLWAQENCINNVRNTLLLSNPHVYHVEVQLCLLTWLPHFECFVNYCNEVIMLRLFPNAK